MFRRKRNQAIVDKKKSLINYDKVENNNENKLQFMKRLSISGLNDNEIDNLKKKAIKDNEQQIIKDKDLLPLPQKILNKNKDFIKPEFHSKAYIINNFDEVEMIDGQYTLINTGNFLNSLKEEEIKQIQLDELFGLDRKEYDKAYKKVDEMKKMAKNIKDTDLAEFFRSKKRSIENEQRKIDVVHNNLERIDDYIIFEDSIKFFFNNSN